jgi:hypothetical protein
MRKIFTIFTIFITATSSFSQTLHLYGGKNHDVYLGCLNCDAYNSNSIWNEYGTYGSKYNTYSPWNAYSSEPPVVVDKDGNFYGYFTVNKYNSKQADFELALTIYSNYDLIMDDVSKWYEKIFE